MIHVRLSRGFFITQKSLSVALRQRVVDELKTLDREWPFLPGEEDDRVVIPPAKPGFVRLIPGTACSLWYSLDGGGVFVHAVKLVA